MICAAAVIVYLRFWIIALDIHPLLKTHCVFNSGDSKSRARRTIKTQGWICNEKCHEKLFGLPFSQFSIGVRFNCKDSILLHKVKLFSEILIGRKIRCNTAKNGARLQITCRKFKRVNLVKSSCKLEDMETRLVR